MFKKVLEKKELLKFFYNYQRPFLKWAIGAGVLMLFNVLLQLPMPLATRYLIDHILPSKNLKHLAILCLLVLGVILLLQLSGFLMRYIFVKYKALVHLRMERDLYCHVQELPMSYFARRPSGYILSRISEVSSLEGVMADTFLMMIRDFITMIVGAVLVLNLHFKLGLISLLVLPLFVLSIKAFHKKIKNINKKLREENAQYTGKLEKNINSIEKIKSAVKEESVAARLTQKLSSLANLRIKAQLINSFAGIVSGFIGLISPFVVLWYGGAEIIKGNLSLGTFFAINSYLAYLYGPARQLTDVGYTISQAMASLERIYEVFSEKTEDPGGEPLQAAREIVFDHVNFSYNGIVPILKDVNLEIRSSEKVAIVGESGQGKSTLIKMILKFYRPDTGHIYFSGKDLQDIAVKSLRKKIAYVSQRQRILEEEFEEKIKDPEVIDLLKKFRFEKSIQETDIFQSEFSGGELQKVELLESILKEAEILIVDEGTSNIDYQSEKIVLTELFSRYKDKIIIFIAHRLSTITDFERIVVIDKGQVVEDGTHTELIERKGRYHELWGMQEEKESLPTQTEISRMAV